MAASIRSAQVPNRERGAWTQYFTPNQEATCNLYPLAEIKSVFTNGVSLGISIILQGRPHVQE